MTHPTDRWIDHYLPHWTTPERSAARYALNGRELQLLIEADQPAWRLEDGELRVTNHQTRRLLPWALRSGRTATGPTWRPAARSLHKRLWTPSAGLVEVAARATSDPTCMLAFWPVGFEEASPPRGGLHRRALWQRHCA